MWAIGEPSGPIENGTTYMMRPRIEPRNRSVRESRIWSGSRQLLVGPASDSRLEQMKVRSSTRATSPGSERARYEFGRLASSSFSKVPASTSWAQSRSYSSAEPSHQWTDSGWVSSAISSTQSASLAWEVGAVAAGVLICRPGLLSSTSLGAGSVATPPYTGRGEGRSALRRVRDDGKRRAAHRGCRRHPAVAGAGFVVPRAAPAVEPRGGAGQAAAAGDPAKAPQGRRGGQDRDPVDRGV